MYIKENAFSLWVDFIERDFIHSTMKELIDQGIINGATSNPAIFKNAFLTSPAYKEDIARLKGTMTTKAIYETMAIADIQAAADVLRPLFDQGDDGFVSIEVDPHLADDAQGTIEEGMRLYKSINRPNVMIKVPATKAGYEAMEALIAEDISVNATLIFSEAEALACAKAFEAGGKKSRKNPQSVISVFVSRLDRLLDPKLPETLQSKAGILNAAKIYNSVEALNISRNRVLFASTGVKGDTLKADYYVTGLLAKNSVNTTPLDTIKAFVDANERTMRLPLDASEIEKSMQSIEAAGVDFEESFKTLKSEGLKQFEEAFSEIMKSLEK